MAATGARFRHLVLNLFIAQKGAGAVLHAARRPSQNVTLANVKPGLKDSPQKNVLDYAVVGLDFLRRHVEKSVSHLIVLHSVHMDQAILVF